MAEADKAAYESATMAHLANTLRAITLASRATEAASSEVAETTTKEERAGVYPTPMNAQKKTIIA